MSMEPKYTQVAAMISFPEYPSKQNLLVSAQEAWLLMQETYGFLDPDSGELSVPIETSSGEIVYVYTMRAPEGREILFTGHGTPIQWEEEE